MFICKNICQQYADHHVNCRNKLYDLGYKYCTNCQFWAKLDNKYCPCCGQTLRYKPRRKR